MKKFLVNLLVLGLLISSASVMAAEKASKGIAVVDVQKVVMSSSKVKKLEQDRIKQEQDIQKYLAKAKSSIDNEKNENKKKALQEKYNKELTQKLNAQKKEVVERTQAIEKDILASVEKKAKDLGYDIVIAKGSVLYGGDDITNEIIKSVK